MGRLKLKLIIKKASKYKKWFAGVLLLVVFTVIYAGVRQHANQANLLLYAGSHQLKTGTELIGGNGQIYYEYKGTRHFVTKDKVNHQSPVASGSYIVWLDESNGQFQTVLYNLKTKQRLQLSTIGNNTGQSVDHNHVAWQSVINDQAVILYFDGVRVQRISGTHAAIRPFVEGNRVLFAQQIATNSWQTILYDDKTGQSKVVAEGSASQAAWPRFENGVIKTSEKGSAKYYF